MRDVYLAVEFNLVQSDNLHVTYSNEEGKTIFLRERTDTMKIFTPIENITQTKCLQNSAKMRHTYRDLMERKDRPK